MNVKHYSLLHKSLRIVLILLLIISPFRSALAIQLLPCEMESMSDDAVANMAVSSHHDIHAMHESAASRMDASHQHHLMQSDSKQAGTDQLSCCCCDDGNSCAGNCDLGVNASLVIRKSSFTPVLIDVTRAPMISTDIVIREPSPPFRPPATLHS